MGLKGRLRVTRSCEARPAKFHTGDSPCQKEIPLQRGSLPSSASVHSLFRPQGIQQERMLSESVMLKDGRNVAGRETHWQMFCKPVKLDWLSESPVFTWFFKVQRPPSSALDRLDQDTGKLFCSIHPTAVGLLASCFSFTTLLCPF